MERWPYVSDWMQLLPHPWLLQVIRILRYVEPCSDSKRININLFSSMHSTKLSIRHNVENLDEPTSSWFLYAGVFPSWVLITVGLWLDTICLLSNFDIHIYLPSVWGCWPVVWPNIQQVKFCFRGSISTVCSHCTCRLWIWVLCRDSGENGLGSQHATLHSCVGAFNLGDIHETRAAANQHSSRERQFWDGLERNTREVMANLTFQPSTFFKV